MIGLGSGYIGSPSLLTTQNENEEIIPSPPKGKSKYNLYRLSFQADQECTIIINNGSPLFLRAGQAFSTNETDWKITSFKIKEKGITYNFIAAY